MSTDFQIDAQQVAGWLRRQAVVVSLAMAAGLLVLPAMVDRLAPDVILATVAVTAALVALALSALLVFDAALFSLMAAQPDERSAARVVDETLAAMRLKPKPARSRGLGERIAGARRLVYWQRLAAGMFMLALAIAYLISMGRAP